MKSIKPGEVCGRVVAPPSKSIMQRALIAAALAEGESCLTNPTFCDDALATLAVIKKLGAEVTKEADKVIIKGGGQPLDNAVLDCGESGTCMRMISVVAALYEKKLTITGRGSLLSRPVGMLEKPLTQLGAACKTNSGLPPISIRGPICGGRIEVDGSETSQFVSGLLMALPLCKEDSDVLVLNLSSKQYVSMTESLLFQFGIRIKSDNRMKRFLINGNQKYKARKYEIDGDWSGAAFMLVAGTIAGGVKLSRLSANSLQADQVILNALKKAGAKIRISKDEVIAEKNELNAFEFDSTHCPDLFPALAVLACNCDGKSVISGVERLRHKESDRAAALVSELGNLGADIKVIGDKMEIKGKRLVGGAVDPHNDHRIAMACAVAALTSQEGVSIKNSECVSKSYPSFFKDLDLLRCEK